MILINCIAFHSLLAWRAPSGSLRRLGPSIYIDGEQSSLGVSMYGALSQSSSVDLMSSRLAI
jgi:hypothetical protein